MFQRCAHALVVRTALVGLVAFVAAFLGGCRHRTSDRFAPYETLAKDPRRDTEAAKRHNARAVRLIEQGHLDDAEKELKTALSADLFFGPAHNNLGTVYLRQEKYYLAAWEFQYAAKTMKDSPEPRYNLGMVYEAVARLDDAGHWYDEALTLAPDSVETTAGLARVRLQQGLRDDRTRELLADLVLKDTRPEWTAWARKQLALLGGANGPTPAAPPASLSAE